MAPCEGDCGAGGGGMGPAGGGCGGSVVGGDGRSEVVRCCAAGRTGARPSVAVAGTAARAPPPSLREDIRL
jgi:hypothetical protein